MSGLVVTYPGAMLAGVLSFASPCILPLVPAYLSFLGGTSLAAISGERPDPALTRRVVKAALGFAAGFVVVFVLLGASATLLGRLVADHLDVFDRISGAVVILFGLQYAGLLKLRPLNYDLRFHLVPHGGGLAGAFVMGLAFAFGWTPCVGPVLATILTLAARQPSIWYGVTLLTCYGVGIAIPFVGAAAALGPFLRAAASLRRRMRWIEVALGSTMVVTGGLMLAGSVSAVSGWLLRTFPVLYRVG